MITSKLEIVCPPLVACRRVLDGKATLTTASYKKFDFEAYVLHHSTDSSMSYLPLTLCGLGQAKQSLGELLIASSFSGCISNGAALTHTEPVLAAAWAAGKAMTIGQAVAYALG